MPRGGKRTGSGRRATKLSRTVEPLKKVQAEVYQLKSDMAYQRDRLETVLAENSNLQQQVQTVVAERDNARREVEDNKVLAQVYERERDEARRENESLRNQLAHFANNLDGQREVNGRQRQELGDTQYKLIKAEAKLAKLQEHFRSVFEEAQAVADANPPVQSMGDGRQDGDIRF